LLPGARAGEAEALQGILPLLGEGGLFLRPQVLVGGDVSAVDRQVDEQTQQQQQGDVEDAGSDPGHQGGPLGHRAVDEEAPRTGKGGGWFNDPVLGGRGPRPFSPAAQARSRSSKRISPNSRAMAVYRRAYRDTSDVYRANCPAGSGASRTMTAPRLKCSR